MNSNDVRDYGAVADDATDTAPAIQSVKTALGSGALVAFGPGPSAGGLYKLLTLADGDLDGLTLDVSPACGLDLPTSAYGPLTDVQFERRTRVYWSDIKCDYWPDAGYRLQRGKENFIGAGDLRAQRLTPISGSTDLVYRSIPGTGTDAFSAESPTYADGQSYSYSGVDPGAWHGGFISLRRGETYQGAVTIVGSGKVGVMFRHSNGYSILASDDINPATAMMHRYIKAMGSPVSTSQDVAFPGMGAYTSYNPQTALWGVTIVDRDHAVITLNGRAVTEPLWITGLGDIFEVGFVWMPSDTSSACSINDLMIERNSDPLGRADLAEVRIFGDSTSDYLVGMWEDDLRDMLDHTFGRKLSAITNLAVSGTNSYDVLQSINANGLGNAYYVVVGIGTNDIQSGASLDTSASNISSILSAIQQQGRVPVMVLPYMWYGQAQAVAGRGQNSTNYDQGARLRAKISRLCAETGAILVDPTRELPEPKPEYVTTQTQHDPLVRDNIHESALGYKLYAWAIARAIASHMAAAPAFQDAFCSIPSDWLENGWTAGSDGGIWQSEQGVTSIQGNVGTGVKTSGTVVLNLPRWARPPVQQTFAVSTDNGYADVVVHTNGDITLGNIPASFSVLNLSNVKFYAG